MTTEPPVSSEVYSAPASSAAMPEPPTPIRQYAVMVGRERRRLRTSLSIAAKVMWTGSCLLSAAMLIANNNRPIDATPMLGIVISFGLAIASVALTWPSRPVDGEIDLEESGPDAAAAAAAVLKIRSRATHKTIRPEHVASAYVSGMALPNRFAVEIELRRGDLLYITVRDRKTADHIVTALGFGPNGKRTRINLDGPRQRLLNLVPAAIAFVATNWLSMSLFPRVGPAPFHILFILVVYQALRRLMRPNAITIGSDGVLVENIFGKSRVAAHDIASMQLEPLGTMSFTRKTATSSNERKQRRPTKVTVRGHDTTRRRAACNLVEARFKARTRDDAATAAFHVSASAFARSGRSLQEWRQHVREVLRGNADVYRASAIRSSSAEEVLADPASTTEERAGAAIALAQGAGGGADPDDSKQRIRIAAESAVDPKTRIILEAIADGDDERVEMAFRRMRSS